LLESSCIIKLNITHSNVKYRIHIIFPKVESISNKNVEMLLLA